MSVAGEGATSDTALVTEPLDRAMLVALAEVVDEATEAFHSYDHTRALESIERFFWSFCDDYLGLVKARAYESDTELGASARADLTIELGGTHVVVAT